eukprot:9090376-Karenia_brevis.AAC.1
MHDAMAELKLIMSRSKQPLRISSDNGATAGHCPSLSHDAMSELDMLTSGIRTTARHPLIIDATQSTTMILSRFLMPQANRRPPHHTHSQDCGLPLRPQLEMIAK